MDIEQYKKNAKIRFDAQKMKDVVAQVISDERNLKEDRQYEYEEIFKPITSNQDEKQNKLIKELQSNQKDIADLIDSNRNMLLNQELPFNLEQPAIESTTINRKEPTILNVDNAFNKDDKIILNNHKLIKPLDLFEKNNDDLNKLHKHVSKINKDIGKKGLITKAKGKEEAKNDANY